MEKFNVLTNMKNGEPLSQEYLYPSGGKKVRTLPKDFKAYGMRTDELFGMNLFTAGGTALTITEGELDAMSVWQMMGGLKSRYQEPVVSMPSATPSGNLWKNCFEWMNSFKKIVLVVDKDDAGNSLANKINNLFPGKVYRVDTGQFKDANDWLVNGKAGDFKGAWLGASKYTPDNVLHSEKDLLKLFRDTPDHVYVPTGITDLDDKILGLMQSHFTVFKAPTGIGKTELMRYLEWNFIEREIPFATWHLEETKQRSLLGLVSYDLKRNVTRRDIINGEEGLVEKVEASIRKIAASECYYQFFLKEDQGADDLCQQIRFFKEAYDCKFVLFEPIQDVISSASAGEKEAELAALSVRLSKLAAELQVGIISIGHTNEDGDFKYCKMIGQRASVVISLHRDKESDDIDIKNTTALKIEKNRPTSEDGRAGEMSFDIQSFTMKQKEYY
jgi:twinkle protein